MATTVAPVLQSLHLPPLRFSLFSSSISARPSEQVIYPHPSHTDISYRPPRPGGGFTYPRVVSRHCRALPLTENTLHSRSAVATPGANTGTSLHESFCAGTGPNPVWEAPTGRARRPAHPWRRQLPPGASAHVRLSPCPATFIPAASKGIETKGNSRPAAMRHRCGPRAHMVAGNAVGSRACCCCCSTATAPAAAAAAAAARVQGTLMAALTGHQAWSRTNFPLTVRDWPALHSE